MIYTKEALKMLLRKMGLRSGMNVLLDASGDFSNIIGQERTLLDAVKEIVGYDATVLVPSFTPDLANCFCLGKNVDYEDMLNIDYSSFVFDANKTLPQSSLAKQLLVYDDIARSHHPLYSCIGWGKYGQVITNQHPLHFAFSKNSPIDKLFELGAYYLSFNFTNVFFDYVAAASHHGLIKIVEVPVMIKNSKVNKPLLEYEMNRHRYSDVMETLVNENIIYKSSFGNHEIYFGSMRKAIGLAVLLLEKNENGIRI